MSKDIIRNELTSYSQAENMKQKHDELQKHFGVAQDSVDTLIAFLEDILMHEDWLGDEIDDDEQEKGGGLV